MNSWENQVKSKERVSNHGEVFTREVQVNAMLDLVKVETERIESRFLEPACGTGNFLVKILERKLNAVEEETRYKGGFPNYELKSIIALSSIYGVELLEDNVEECRERLFELWNQEYTRHCKNESKDCCRKVAAFILQRNILCGDALTLLTNDNTPIIFSEWEFMDNDIVIRRDYRFDELLKNQDMQPTLDMANNWHYDEEINGLIPNPIKEYPPMDYLEVSECG